MTRLERRAALFKALACETRLNVLEALRRGECTGSDLVRACRITKANLSQHLRVLRAAGVVRCVRDGSSCRYSLISRKLIDALRALERSV